MSDNPLERQVGGNHYRTMAIQPVEFILANGLGFCEGNVIKYLCRRKGTRLTDLEKARHYLDILIAHERGQGPDDGADHRKLEQLVPVVHELRCDCDDCNLRRRERDRTSRGAV